MARPKTAQLGADLIPRKGEALPAGARVHTTESRTDPDIPRGTKDTVAVTVRLDAERYRRLVSYGIRFTPRRTNQEIFIAALDAYLAQVEE